jgi:hypothetical protein
MKKGRESEYENYVYYNDGLVSVSCQMKTKSASVYMPSYTVGSSITFFSGTL